MSPSILITTALLAINALAAPLEERSTPRCKEVNFIVTGSACNLVISDPTNLTAAIGNASIDNTTPVSGTQTLAGWYCNPSITNANNTKLQVFRGSFFTNRESWTALGGTGLFNPPLSQYQPDMYSWFDFANKLGYPTLAIDTLGDGASSRPDGTTVTQIPYDLALYHDLVQQIRTGTTTQLPKPYTYLIHVGNSLGSVIGNQMAAYYPQDFNMTVLTGFSKLVQPSLPGVSLNMPGPAALVNATRFAGVPLDYITSTNEQSLTNSFFGDPTVVDFDPAIADLFFQRRDTVSLGDVVSTYVPGSAPVAAEYTRPVLVITGENDQAFCGEGSSALSPDTMCGALLQETGTLFPAAAYSWKSVPRTGHAIILHKSAQTTFTVAHQFMNGASFSG